MSFNRYPYYYNTQHKDAVKEFKKSKNFMGLVRLKEEEGNYDDAVKLLVDNNKREKALECAQRYEREGHILREELLASSLAIRYAKMCEPAPTQKDRDWLVKFVNFMGDPMDCVYYLKMAKKYREALNILCNEGGFNEAYRVCAAQGWVDDGLKLAEEKKNHQWIQQFMFQKTIISLCRPDIKLDPVIITKLHSLMNNPSTNDQVRAKACLLFGKIKCDFFICRRAFGLYLRTQNAAGCVEAFNLMVQFRIKESKSAAITIWDTLNACNSASSLIHLLDTIMSNESPLSTAQEQKLAMVEEFYGLQKQLSDPSVYFITPAQHIWMEFFNKKVAFDTDPDGMMRINSTNALQLISNHVQKFLERWQKNDELDICQLFRAQLRSFDFHKQFEDEDCVTRSFKIKYQGKLVNDYLELCCSGIQISEFGKGEISQSYVVQLLVNFLKPVAAIYLGVTKRQMEWLAKCSCAALLEQRALKTIRKLDRDFNVDDWLEAWTILGILGKDHLLRQLDKCTANVKELSRGKIPPTYQFSVNDNVYVHVFSLWIRSCFLLRREKKVITSSKVMLHFFLNGIIRSRKLRLSLSIPNLVNILTIHSTALLLLTALCNFLQHKRSNVLIPMFFEDTLNVFDNLGKLSGDHITVFDACINDVIVLKAYDKMREKPYGIQNIQKDIASLIRQILDLLLGIGTSKYSKYFHPLIHSMRSDNYIKRGETRHCLLLSLVLLHNLTEIDNACSQTDIQTYHQCMINAFTYLQHSGGEELQTLQKAYDILSSSSNTSGFFSAIHDLIIAADPRGHIVRIVVKQQPWRFELERAQIAQFPSHPLLPTMSLSAQLSMDKGSTVPSRNDKRATSSVQLTPQQKQSTIPSITSLKRAIDSSFNPPAQVYVGSASNVYEEVAISDVGQATSTGTVDNENVSVSPPSSLLPTDTETAELTTQSSVEAYYYERDEIRLDYVEADEELKDLTLASPFLLDRQSSETTVDQHTMTDNVSEDFMLEKTFCGYCGISLTSDEVATPVTEHGEAADKHQEVQSSEEVGDQLLVENFTSHCNSKTHAHNKKAYEIFTTHKRNYYDPLKDKLCKVLQDLKDFDNEHIASSLRTTIQNIEKQLENNERELKELKFAGQWKEAASTIEQNMHGRMDSLIDDAEKRLSKERARLQREQHDSEQAASVEMSADEDRSQLENEAGSQSEEEISSKLDPIDAKEKERQRKRLRKKMNRRRKK